MALSNDLISEYVKVTKPKEEQKKETTVYGTVQDYGGEKYVRLDGSELLTPIVSTTDIQFGERVTVMIKDHTATVTGNLTDPSASDSSVRNIGDQISEFDIILAGKVDTVELVAVKGRIDTLETNNVKVNDTLIANNASINDLYANNVKIEQTLTAHAASIEELDTKKLSAESADIKYANIDFTNIGQAAMEYFYAQSGLIKDVTIDNQTLTGELIGVTIKGDLIEGGTIVADKLVMKGTDGLYYKLNTDGMKIAAEQTEYNSLNGSVITAKSITAEKVSVSDLVAFDATIGGFNITSDAIYSGVKTTLDNTTNGIHLHNDGQLNIGDTNNFIKYHKNSDGEYVLEISASNIKFTSENNGLISAINQSAEGVKISSNKIELEGAVTFSSLDSNTQTIINNAQSTADDAQMAADDALTAANTANANATNAMNTVNTANSNATTALNAAKAIYATCSTSSSTAAKVATVSSGTFGLFTGARVTVKFTYANTASNATLNVNSTGAKYIYAYGSRLTNPYNWAANATITFVYDGSYWQLVSSSVDDAIKNWCYANNKSYINGGKIYANSVTAAQIDVDNLFAQNLTATGNIFFSNDKYEITGSGDVIALNSFGDLSLQGGSTTVIAEAGKISLSAMLGIKLESGRTVPVTIDDNVAIHAGNISDYVGTVYSTTGSNTNLSADTTTTLCSLYLPAGKYIMSGWFGAYNSSGYMQVQGSITNGSGTGYARTSHYGMYGIYANPTVVIEASSSQYWYLKAYASGPNGKTGTMSGTPVIQNVQFRAIKIG